VNLSLVIFFSVGKSVGNKKILLPMDLLTEKASKKINYRFIPSVFPSVIV
jgi:hypothetical protein